MMIVGFFMSPIHVAAVVLSYGSPADVRQMMQRNIQRVIIDVSSKILRVIADIQAFHIQGNTSHNEFV
jgi:hypothetical protein